MAQHIINTDDALDAEAENGANLAGFDSLDSLYQKVTADCVQASRQQAAAASVPPIEAVDLTAIAVSSSSGIQPEPPQPMPPQQA